MKKNIKSAKEELLDSQPKALKESETGNEREQMKPKEV